MSKEDLVLKKIKSVELKTKKLVSALNLGDYKSAMKGQGMTFSDFREYVPGDDVRNISWASIAKTNKPYVKQFEEERELDVYFLMDTSYSMFFGSKNMLKIEVAMYVMASIAMSAQKNNDLSGLMLYSKNLDLFVNPKKGLSHVRRLITEVIKFKPYINSSDGLSEACNMLLEHQKKKSIVFIFSDFSNFNFNKKIFQGLAKKHQVVACVIKDPQSSSEAYLNIGNFKISNSMDSLFLNTSWSFIRRLWGNFLDKKNQEQSTLLKSLGVEQIEFFTDKDFYKPLVMYFKRKSGSK